MITSGYLINRMKSIAKRLFDDICILIIPIFQKRALYRLKGKKKLKCVFFVWYEEMWKCEGVYNRMIVDDGFDPFILVCPVKNRDKKDILDRMDRCYSFFMGKGYRVINAYDRNKDKYMDVDKDLSPDIIFYSYPYEGVIDENFFVTRFLHKLTIYVSYAYVTSNYYRYFYDQIIHNLVWRYYVENESSMHYSKLFSRCKGRNAVNTGYPGIEPFIKDKIDVSLEGWKLKDRKLKRIIWAPHHSIEKEGEMLFSCFLMYCDFMLELAEKYNEKVQFVFRPHPELRNRLKNVWDEEKIENYYNKWKLLYNGSFHKGNYVDLFFSSDAIIHDCGSYIQEYLFMNKPAMRTMNGMPLEDNCNPFTIECIDMYYKAYNKEDIEEFVRNVINDVDPMKEKREKFVNEVLKPKFPPSELIVKDIIDSIESQKLYNRN